MLTWLIEWLPWDWQVNIGVRLWGDGFHEYLCPCGETPDLPDDMDAQQTAG